MRCGECQQEEGHAQGCPWLESGIPVVPYPALPKGTALLTSGGNVVAVIGIGEHDTEEVKSYVHYESRTLVESVDSWRRPDESRADAFYRVAHEGIMAHEGISIISRPDMPRGTAKLISGDQVLTIENIGEDALVAIEERMEARTQLRTEKLGSWEDSRHYLGMSASAGEQEAAEYYGAPMAEDGAQGRHPPPLSRPPSEKTGTETMDSRIDLVLLKSIISTRDAMGWNPTTMDNLPTRLMCVVCELYEVEVELHVSDKPRLGLELADVAIYLIVMIYDLTNGAWGSRTVRSTPSPYNVPEVLTAPIRARLTMCMERWRHVDLEHRASDVRIALELALFETFRLAHALDLHLQMEIAEKLTILREREERNGGKHPDS